MADGSPPDLPAVGKTPAVRLTGVSKHYGAVRALQGIDFELRNGEVMALLGENGAGKSTLVKVLSGLVTPDDGVIEINGEVTALGSSRNSQAAGIAVVQQEYSSVPCLSVAENLFLGDVRSGLWWGPRRLRRGVRHLLTEVGLEHVDPGQLVETLSVAEVQLLELARMLRRDAQILILDEPTAALSDAEIERVLRVVRGLAENGRSVVYVTHRLAEVFEIADRVTVFNSGKSQAALPVAGLDVDAVIRMMLGRELKQLFPDRHAVDRGQARMAVVDVLADGLAEPVTFELAPGEILGLTGQLGSGAGAVVQAIAGERALISGTISVDGDGRPIHGRVAAAKRGIGYCSADRKLDGLFQETDIQLNLSAPWLSSVSRGGWLAGARERREARRICAEFAIDVSRIGMDVEKLSGGNQQKVALGRWLGSSPSLLVVEEPTRGVDVGARAELYRTLRQLSDSGMSIIVASSDTSEVLGLCDRIGSFYRGVLTDMRTYQEWDEPSLVRAVMHRSEATYVHH